MAEAGAADGAGEDRGDGAWTVWGRVPPPSSAAHSDIGCRREERQREDTWAPRLQDRYGSPVL